MRFLRSIRAAKLPCPFSTLFHYGRADKFAPLKRHVDGGGLVQPSPESSKQQSHMLRRDFRGIDLEKGDRHAQVWRGVAVGCQCQPEGIGHSDAQLKNGQLRVDEKQIVEDQQTVGAALLGGPNIAEFLPAGTGDGGIELGPYPGLGGLCPRFGHDPAKLTFTAPPIRPAATSSQKCGQVGSSEGAPGSALPI
jgi:hypothetical protein